MLDAFHEEVGGGEEVGDERGRGQPLVVSGDAPVGADPCQTALVDTAALLHDEPALVRRPGDNLDANGRIGPDALTPAGGIGRAGLVRGSG